MTFNEGEKKLLQGFEPGFFITGSFCLPWGLYRLQGAKEKQVRNDGGLDKGDDSESSSNESYSTYICR